MTKNSKNASEVNNSILASRVAPNTSIQSFSFDHDTIVEVAIVNGEPWFVAADVCRALGLLNPTDHIVKSLDDDEHLLYKIYRAGQNRTVNMVSESGLYTLVVRSTKPDAKKFRKWVTSEVLPSIRKTGAYSVHEPYPGKMSPTNCVVLTCHTAGGASKQAYLLYDASDMWFGCPKWCPDYENVMQSMMKRIGEYDKETTSYETRGYSLKNGKYAATPFLYPKHDKRPKTENAVTNCETAIERYRKARQDVKASAEMLAEYMNVKV